MAASRLGYQFPSALFLLLSQYQNYVTAVAVAERTQEKLKCKLGIIDMKIEKLRTIILNHMK